MTYPEVRAMPLPAYEAFVLYMNDALKAMAGTK